MLLWRLILNCVDIVTKFTGEQYTTINQQQGIQPEGETMVVRVARVARVFVNCLQVTCKQLTKTLGSKRPAVD